MLKIESKDNYNVEFEELGIINMISKYINKYINKVLYKMLILIRE